MSRGSGPRIPGAYTLLLAELIEAREQLGHTQRSFAPLLDVCQNTLSQYETGTRIPSAVRLFEWAELAGVDLGSREAQ